jgi:hypothetical protein
MEIGSPFGEFSVVQEQGGRLQQNNIVTPSVTRDIAETKNVAPVTSVKSVSKKVMEKVLPNQ